MTRCGLCGSWLEFSGHVGEFELRDWLIGKAVAEKLWTCESCLNTLKAFIEEMKKADLPR